MRGGGDLACDDAPGHRAFRSAARDTSGLRPIDSPLTAREWEVIELLAPGHSTDHVADVLVVSIETVRSHVKNIMRKLGVNSRADAVAAAERLRIVTPGAAGWSESPSG